MTRWLRSFGAFWDDFIIGDDWRGAAVVAAALAATALLVLVPVVVLVALGYTTLLRRTRALVPAGVKEVAR